MTQMIATYGLTLVFLNVLAAQAGLPVPAVPLLLAMGALAAEESSSVSAILAVAVAAAILADSVWYALGRLYGHRVMRILCRISSSPDTCLSFIDACFARWGALALVVAKFVPGLSTIAPPLAGHAGMTWARFLASDGLGAVLWVSAMIGLGNTFRDEISEVLGHLKELGTIAAALISILLGVYLVHKGWKRRRLHQMLWGAQISVGELQRIWKSDTRPLIVDLRTPMDRYQDPRAIPGALALQLSKADAKLANISRDRAIIFYFSGPPEAASMLIAEKLIGLGYRRARVLLGGLEAWIAANGEVEFRSVRSPACNE